jgi:hypothetical protein
MTDSRVSQQYKVIIESAPSAAAAVSQQYKVIIESAPSAVAAVSQQYKVLIISQDAGPGPGPGSGITFDNVTISGFSVTF